MILESLTDELQKLKLIRKSRFVSFIQKKDAKTMELYCLWKAIEKEIQVKIMRNYRSTFCRSTELVDTLAHSIFRLCLSGKSTLVKHKKIKVTIQLYSKVRIAGLFLCHKFFRTKQHPIKGRKPYRRFSLVLSYSSQNTLKA